MLENNKLSAVPQNGITLAQIARCLDDWRRDEHGRLENSLLCRSQKINKWAKCKPVSRPKWSALTADERRSSSPGQAEVDGVYWGVKIASGATSEEYLKLHDVGFEYVERPTGGSVSPFRMSDFDGYYHNAEPTIYGSANGVYFNIDHSIDVNLSVDTTGWNTMGIDYADILRRTLDGSDTRTLEQTVGTLYPCILLTFDSGTYAHALLSDADNDNIVPLYSTARGAWNRQYHVPDIASGLENDLHIGMGYQLLNCRVSIFLTKRPQSGGWFDTWKEVRDGAGELWEPAYAIPGTTGLDMRLERYVAGYVPRYTGETDILIVSGQEGVTFTATVNPVITPGRHVTVIFATKRGTTQKSVRLDAVHLNAEVFYTWDELGFLPMPGMSPVSDTLTLRADYDNGSTIISNFESTDITYHY